MRNEMTRYVYSLVTRLSKFARHHSSGDDSCGDLAMMGVIFGRDSENRVRMTDISRKLMISKPAATQVINRLVEKGLVERIRDEADRRVIYIRPTDPGIEMFESALAERLKDIQRAIDRVGIEKAQQLGMLLDEFVDALVSDSED